jgi:carbon starvation protein
MFNAGRGRYAPLTILPMLFVLASTMTAAYRMLTGPFTHMIEDGLQKSSTRLIVQGSLNIFFTLFMVASVLLILFEAVARWRRQP